MKNFENIFFQEAYILTNIDFLEKTAILAVAVYPRSLRA